MSPDPDTLDRPGSSSPRPASPFASWSRAKRELIRAAGRIRLMEDQSNSRELRGVALRRLAPSDWFDQPEKSSFWLQIYACVLVPHDSFEQSVRAMFEVDDKGSFALRPGSRLAFASGRADGIKVPFTVPETTTAPSGQLKVLWKVDSKPLPDMPFVFLATPFKINGIDGDEAEAKSLLEEVRALVSLHAGQNLMRHIVFEGEVEAGRDQIHVPGEAVKMPQLVEGPFLAEQNGKDIFEISAALRALPEEDRRRRLLLSLQLVDHAMRSHFGFLDYWTALEVVCDGQSNNIKAALAKIYGIKSHNEAATATGLDVLAQWRHDYVHRGIKPVVSADVERYMQLLFLDLLRHQLGLPLRAHLAAIQGAEGYNLSPLGIHSK